MCTRRHLRAGICAHVGRIEGSKERTKHIHVTSAQKKKNSVCVGVLIPHRRQRRTRSWLDSGELQTLVEEKQTSREDCDGLCSTRLWQCLTSRVSLHSKRLWTCLARLVSLLERMTKSRTCSSSVLWSSSVEGSATSSWKLQRSLCSHEGALQNQRSGCQPRRSMFFHENDK